MLLVMRNFAYVSLKVQLAEPTGSSSGFGRVVWPITYASSPHKCNARLIRWRQTCQLDSSRGSLITVMAEFSLTQTRPMPAPETGVICFVLDGRAQDEVKRYVSVRLVRARGKTTLLWPQFPPFYRTLRKQAQSF